MGSKFIPKIDIYILYILFKGRLSRNLNL